MLSLIRKWFKKKYLIRIELFMENCETKIFHIITVLDKKQLERLLRISMSDAGNRNKAFATDLILTQVYAWKYCHPKSKAIINAFKDHIWGTQRIRLTYIDYRIATKEDINVACTQRIS